MTFTALLFGDDTSRVLDPLVQRGDEAPAHIWVPLDVEHASGRSGWHIVPRTRTYYGPASDVYCAWPRVFLRWYLGPHALLPDSALAGRVVSRTRVKRRDGIWHARVPRFFATIGSSWSKNTWYDNKRSPDAGQGSCVKKIDLHVNLEDHDPILIVGPDGPCFYEPTRTPGFEARRLAAIEPLMRLPPRTGVSLVTFYEHDESTDEPESWSRPYRSRYRETQWQTEP